MATEQAYPIACYRNPPYDLLGEGETGHAVLPDPVTLLQGPGVYQRIEALSCTGGVAPRHAAAAEPVKKLGAMSDPGAGCCTLA
ncbi:hypothetical protein NDU88_005084 [Pleurodeles waltl]|uniref:Uncharacterized protein n=1 Tax=Pleurodeles waltl TaxID=8319 RepID=A0AAV7SKN3_PLEWA|nr:hypothetical protein NDU88_005084 [Pleurodeles waltl]